jgi:hypothetical protein
MRELIEMLAVCMGLHYSETLSPREEKMQKTSVQD